MLGGHGLFTWGPTVERMLRDDDRDDQPGRRLARRARAGVDVRRPALRGACRAEAARNRRAARCRHSQAHLERRAQDRPFHATPGSAGVRQFPRSRSSGRARHVLPRSFPAHQNPPARAAVRSGAQSSSRSLRRLDERSTPIAPTTRPTTSAANVPTRPPMRDPNAVVYLIPRRRHADVRQGQGDGAHRGRVLRQCDQRDARRVRASAAMSASPSRRRSTSNIGCWRKPSCSGMPKPNRSPAGSRWSPAARAASGRLSRRG